ncbi:uncharacterized protein [Rutidosis leptorrhynchoides]|uniref:uncharacterized protein n=1 Tax=Rutidosis leptorrhynchoides TaxID=125765 RepID=UPI003A99216A
MRWLHLVKDYDCDILYHLGKANLVADALSQKTHYPPIRVKCLVVVVTPTLYDNISEAQVSTLESGQLKEWGIKVQVDLFVHYSRGLTMPHGRIWVPSTNEATKNVFEVVHKSKYSIHSGATKMYKDLKGIIGGRE